MNLPFTRNEFLEVFARYNETVWPAHAVLVALAALAVFSVVRNGRQRNPIASGVLALLWFWSGLVYHLWFFAAINPVAIAFGVLFLVQSGLWFHWGIRRSRVRFEFRFSSGKSIIGALVMAYALVVYPLLAVWFGPSWPRTPTFGVPCPLVLFTLGLLFWTDASLPKSVLIVPLAWVLVGTSAAVELGIYEDGGLIVAGLLAAALLLPRRRARGVSDERVPHRKNISHPVG
jgi:hypothetical protein